jgi:hypothetical protein
MYAVILVGTITVIHMAHCNNEQQKLGGKKLVNHRRRIIRKWGTKCKRRKRIREMAGN